MSERITIRLPDDVVEFIDDQLAAGTAASRSDVVVRALRADIARASAVRLAALGSTEPDARPAPRRRPQPGP